MARANRLVIGIEQIAESRHRIRDSRCRASSRNVSKNQVVCARCHLAGLASGMDCTIWSSAESGAARRSVSARTASKRLTDRRRRLRCLRTGLARMAHRNAHGNALRKARMQCEGRGKSLTRGRLIAKGEIRRMGRWFPCARRHGLWRGTCGQIGSGSDVNCVAERAQRGFVESLTQRGMNVNGARRCLPAAHPFRARARIRSPAPPHARRPPGCPARGDRPSAPRCARNRHRRPLPWKARGHWRRRGIGR